MKITYLGQAGLLFEKDDFKVMIDPYLSNSVEKINSKNYRRVAVDESFFKIKPDVMVFTHNHLDHYDPETVEHFINENSNITVLAPKSVWDEVRKIGGNNNYVMFNRHTEWTQNNINFTAVKAEHTDITPIGVIIDDGEKTYYITGDTLYNEDIFNDIDSLDRFVETVILNSADLGFGTDPVKGMDFFTVSVEEFQRVFETNLVWNFMIVRQAAFRMREHHKGAIVFIGSNTSYHALPNRSAYGASKGGINAMSKSFAIDLGPYGIRSNVVLPGTIKTARWVEMGSKQIVNGTLTPIGDISDFEDIANAAWYLGSDQSKNVTGTELTVDGGMTAQLYPQILNDYYAKCEQNNLLS